MLVSAALVLLALAFYGFIAFSPQEVVQVALVGMWVLLILSFFIAPFFT